VNGDGEDDLLAVFLYGETELPLGESRACLTGDIAGDPFEAFDTVLVFLPGCGLGFEVTLLLPPLLWLRTRRRKTLARWIARTERQLWNHMGHARIDGDLRRP
jgi:hypothetical protein